jgi:hypothetical protein
LRPSGTGTSSGTTRTTRTIRNSSSIAARDATGVEPTGIIFAALDCDADAVEAWNRWYDLEHTPPNVLLDGVMLSRRYVSPPELHEARIAALGSPFDGGRATFLTTYVLTGDPMTAFQGMTGLREELVAAGRMAFPDEKKAVREGDVFATVDAVGSAETRCVAADVPFVGHHGVVVIQRRGGDSRAHRLVALDGVHGVWTLESLTRPGLQVDLVFVEGDLPSAAARLRAAAPHRDDAGVVVDAPYLLIDPLRYPWAEAIRTSHLPRTVA